MKVQNFSFLIPALRPNSPRQKPRSAHNPPQRRFTGHGPALSEPVPGSCYPRRDQNPTRWFCAQDLQLLLPKICRPTHAEGKELMPISRNSNCCALDRCRRSGLPVGDNPRIGCACAAGSDGELRVPGRLVRPGAIPPSTAPSAGMECFSPSPMRTAILRPVTLWGCHRTW